MDRIPKNVLLGILLAGAAGLFVPVPARAQEKIPVVATLPVLADLVEAVGGTGSR